MITKETFDRLSYIDQEMYLIRCDICQLKYEPFDLLWVEKVRMCEYCFEEYDNE